MCLTIPILGCHVFDRQVVAQVGRALETLFAVGAIMVLIAVMFFEFVVGAEKLSYVYSVIRNRFSERWRKIDICCDEPLELLTSWQSRQA